MNESVERRHDVATQNHEDVTARLELAMAAGELGMWDWDVTTDRMDYSDRAKTICGFPLDQAVTLEQVRACTHPEDLPFTHAQALRSLDPAIREKQPYEYRIVRNDGQIRWVLAYGQAVFEEKEGKFQATRYIGTIQDITARKQIEQELRAAATRLSLALTVGQMAVWEFDGSGTLKTSPELNRILGFGETENPTVEDIRARYFPGEQERIRQELRNALASGQRIFDCELRYVWPDQSVRWLWVRAQLNPPGLAAASIGIVQDITERKAHEQRLDALLHELSHRSKNLLQVIQAVTRQTARSSTSPAQFEQAMLGRVQALAAAHDLLLRENWRGAAVAEVIDSQLRAFKHLDRQRISVEGPDAVLHSSSAQDLGVCMHELATNALQHGALSNPHGRVTIKWHVHTYDAGKRLLRLTWSELGGPTVEPPKRRGFGAAMLARGGDSIRGTETGLQFLAEGIRWSREWHEPEFSIRAAPRDP